MLVARKKKARSPKSAVPGLILLVLGLIITLGWLDLGMGIAGQVLVTATRQLVGQAGLVLSLCLMWWGGSQLLARSRVSPVGEGLRQAWPGPVLFLCLVTALHLPHLPVAGLEAVTPGQGGGWAGAAVWWLLYPLLGPVGGTMLVAGAALVALNAATGRGLARGARKIWDFFHRWLRRRPATGLDNRHSETQPPLFKREKASQESLPSAGDGPAPEAGDYRVGEDQERDGLEVAAALPSEQTGAGADNGSVAAERAADASYQLPPVSLLSAPPEREGAEGPEDGQRRREKLQGILTQFGIEARVIGASSGPGVTRYELQLAPGTKVSRIVALADDLGLHLEGTQVRVEAPIPGKAAVGIEVPRTEIRPVYLREVAETPQFQQHSSPLALALGVDIGGEPVIGDIHQLHHLLIAGATGSGKSVCLNTILASLLLRGSPEAARLILIDPKRVEFASFHELPHLLSPVVVDAEKAASALTWALRHMEERYRLLAEASARDLPRFNETRSRRDEMLPRVVVVIDELADLMLVTPHEVEDAICRLAQMGRAAGIHLVVATQRPSVDVITGLIKANIPSRISFAVSSQADSRTILDGGGAERLQGQGDMLYLPVGAAKARRMQGAFVPDADVENLTSYWRRQEEPHYLEEVLQTETPPRGRRGQGQKDEDALLPEALELVAHQKQASASMLQRRFRIGYTRAARILDLMEEKGWVGPSEGSKARAVLVTTESIQRQREAQPFPEAGPGEEPGKPANEEG